MDQLKEEIKDDARFRAMYNDLVEQPKQPEHPMQKVKSSTRNVLDAPQPGPATLGIDKETTTFSIGSGRKLSAA